MPEMKREIAEMCIRTDLNILYLTSRMIASVLQMADTMPAARQTLQTAAESMMMTAADVYGRILRDYGEDIPDPCGTSSIPLNNMEIQ